MSHLKSLSLATAAFTLLAGCSNFSMHKSSLPAQAEKAVANDPNVENVQRLVRGLTSLTDVTERMKASKLRQPEELCFGTIIQADLMASRAADAIKFYNAAPGSNELFVSNLQKRVANIDIVFSDLSKICPAESKALGVPSKLELQTVPGTKQLRLAVIG